MKRDQQMILEINNYLNKSITLGINCFHIHYTENKLKKNKIKNHYYAQAGCDILKYNIENIDFIISVTKRVGKLVFVDHFLGVRPIITPMLNRKNILASLYELFLLYDNMQIYCLTFSDKVSEKIKTVVINDKTSFSLIGFNKKYFQLMASLFDFLTNNYNEEEIKIEMKDNIYNIVEDNFSEKFDEYSLLNVFNSFLKMNNYKVKGLKILDASNDLEIFSLEKFFENEIEMSKFLQKYFYSQTNLIDFKRLFKKNKDKLFEIFKKNATDSF